MDVKKLYWILFVLLMGAAISGSLWAYGSGRTLFMPIVLQTSTMSEMEQSGTPSPNTTDSFDVTQSTATFDYVTDVTAIDDDPAKRIFVLEKEGVVSILSETGEVSQFIDLRDRVCPDGSEDGLLSMAFSPDYDTTGRFYIAYIGSEVNDCGEEHRLRVSRFVVSADDPNRADDESENKVYSVNMGNSRHNGGGLMFNPIDGMLYLSVGDDTNPGLSIGDDSAHGKLMRLDVSGDGTADSEEAARGLRNPWRFGIDPTTGDIYIGDVGSRVWEEINYLRYGATGRDKHFGWYCMEGSDVRFDTGDCEDALEYAQPIFAYGHNNGYEPLHDGCSVTAGDVVGGSPRGSGYFIFTDYCQDDIYGLHFVDGNWETHLFGTLSDETHLLVTDMHALPNDDLIVASYGDDEPLFFVHLPLP